MGELSVLVLPTGQRQPITRVGIFQMAVTSVILPGKLSYIAILPVKPAIFYKMLTFDSLS